MPFYRGIRYKTDGCSPETYRDRDGNEAPPEAARMFVKKQMRRWAIKEAGRPPKMGLTEGEQRLALLEGGMDLEQIADHCGVEIETVTRTIRRAQQRRRKKAGQ